MTPERYQQIKQVYLEARELEGTARDAYLDAACGPDDTLRREVEGLLADGQAATGFLESPALGDALNLSDLQRAGGPVPEPEQIGPYRIIRKVGEGGMGVVYEAEQTEPIRRRVALKLIKVGMDTKNVIARFETERQALALMSHANIARVLDAGATEQGRPYFVMEYVLGVPITDHCDEQRLPIEERLSLFSQVCEAVQHAHQKGIIHRDLSARNVLIEFVGGRATVKVIDFGIAKATDRRQTEQTSCTEHGRAIGTPEYMSPEQVDPANQDIDTRADVYSLGVLLYELLSGELPFGSKELRKQADAEIQRIIREDDPPKPSIRLSLLSTRRTTKGTDLARNRRTDVCSLTRRLRRDLDWIVMKCLEKDRGRRYETAASLGADIGRHLRHEPVMAGPPSAAYRMRKFVRRNRGLVASATVVACVLVIGTTVAMAGWRAAAEGESKARLSLDFLKSILSSVDPDVAGKRDTTLLQEILDNAARRIDFDLSEQPEVEAELRGTLGAIYGRLGDYPLATLFLEDSLQDLVELRGTRALAVARIKTDLGEVRMEQADYAAAESLFRESLEVCREELGPENARVAECVYNLGENTQRARDYKNAEPLYRQALIMRRRVLGEDHPKAAECLVGLGVVHYGRGNLPEAERAFREAYGIVENKLSPTHSTVLASCNNLAVVLARQGRSEEAMLILKRNLEATRQAWGDNHVIVAWALNNLALQYQGQGKLGLAERQMREACEIRRAKLGETHSNTIDALNNLAQVLMTAKKYADAVAPLKTCLAYYREHLGEDEEFTVKTMGYLTMSLYQGGLLEEAETLGRECVERSRRVFPHSPQTLVAHLEHLAWTTLKMEKHIDCAALFREVIEIRGRLGEKDTWIMANTKHFLAIVLRQQGQTAEAESLFAEALGILFAIDGDPEHIAACYWRLGECQASTGHYAEAEESLLKAYQIRTASPSTNAEAKTEVVQLLVGVFDAWHAAEPGKGYDAKATEWRAKLESLESSEPLATTQPGADVASQHNEKHKSVEDSSDKLTPDNAGNEERNTPT